MQAMVANYINDNHVMVVVMAPSCRAFGPPSCLNCKINPEGCERSFRTDLPHLEFCGKMALLQTRKGRCRFAEISWLTWLWILREWQYVHQDPHTEKQVVHQCRLGRRGRNVLLELVLCCPSSARYRRTQNDYAINKAALHTPPTKALSHASAVTVTCHSRGQNLSVSKASASSMI